MHVYFYGGHLIMKFHITNLYSFNQSDTLISKQHRFANAALELGFREMGIFSYPVETDSQSELSRRLDGIISSLEYEDMVFMQLPSGNGYAYDNLLFHKIKSYHNTKLILIFHEIDILKHTTDYFSMCQSADAVIIPSRTMASVFTPYGIRKLLFYDAVTASDSIKKHQAGETTSEIFSVPDIPSIFQTDFYVKKILMDAIESVFVDSLSTFNIQPPVAENEIQIAFGLHDKTGHYSVWVGTAMQSIMEHTASKICFHIMHDSTLTELNKSRLLQTAAFFGQRVVFYPIDVNYFSTVKDRVKGYSIATMFRIVLPDLLSDLGKIIYLDADILVARDIKELWETDISNYCIAAVPDMLTFHKESSAVPIYTNMVSQERYFNAGVLYMNLAQMRKQGNLLNATLNYLSETPETELLDQDALNVIYKDSVLLLDESWNYWASFVRKRNETQLSKKLYHYVGTRLHLFYLNEMDSLYYETLIRTPWGFEEAQRHLTVSLTRIADSEKQRGQLIKQLTQKKKFIFYGSEDQSLSYFYRFVDIREGDYRILINHQTDTGNILPCHNFSRLTEEERGSYILFVSPLADNNTALDNVEKLGLQKGIDYFNILQLLLPDEFGYL